MSSHCYLISSLIIICLGFYGQITAAEVTFFRCLGCSYSSYPPSSGQNCLNATDRITFTVQCNSTSACTHSEQIDRRTGKVKSVFRSCQVDRGTTCDRDYTNYNCVTSCKSELCNNRTDMWTDIKLPHGGNTAPHVISTLMCNICCFFASLCLLGVNIY